MTLRETLELIHSDYRRYRATGPGQGNWFSVVMLTQGLWATCIYRLGHFSVTSIQWSLLAWPVRIGFLVLGKLTEIVTGIRLSPECVIGRGLYIGHFGQIFVNYKVRIGCNCNLSQGVTIGAVQSGERKGVPTLGDRVYVGPNAVVIGNIDIGHDVAIGAGAVVVKSLPPSAVAVGNPAEVVSFKGSFGWVSYDGKEEDEERKWALERCRGQRRGDGE